MVDFNKRLPRPSISDIPEQNESSGFSHPSLRFLFTPQASNVTVRGLPVPGKETIIRPFPAYDRESGQILPYRYREGNTYKHSPWIQAYDMGFKLGRESVSYIVNPSYVRYAVEATPLEQLCKAIRMWQKDVREGKRPASEHPDFPFLMQQGPKSNKLLSSTKRVYVIQGLLPLVNSEWTYQTSPAFRPPLGQKPSYACLFFLPGGFVRSFGDPDKNTNTARKLLDLLDLENEGRFHSDDFVSRYVHGDPVDPEHGAWLRFRKVGTPRFDGNVSTSPNRLATQQVQGGYGGYAARAAQAMQAQPTQAAAASAAFDGYLTEVDREPLSDGALPNLSSEPDLENIREQWQDLDQILRVPESMTEQAHILNEIFCDFPSAIVYAFESYNREWITEATYDRFHGRHTVQTGMQQQPEPPREQPRPAPAPAPRSYSSAPANAPRPPAQPARPAVTAPTRQSLPAPRDASEELDDYLANGGQDNEEYVDDSDLPPADVVTRHARIPNQAATETNPPAPTSASEAVQNVTRLIQSRQKRS